MKTPDPAPPELSVLVPVFNEEDSIPALAEEIDAAMEALARPWECLWIDDGSTDRTPALLEALHSRDPRHRWAALRPNAGQSAALAAGLREARAALVAVLDGDGQNDPADIAPLLRRLEQGDVDMVNGVRQTRRDSPVRIVCSRLGNGFRNWLTGDHIRDVGCSLRVFRREFLDDVPVFKGMHRFLPTLARMRGCRVTELPVNHRPRLKGVTKYGIGNRLWVGLADTFAVRWMQRRLVWPQVRARSPENVSGTPS